ncbi:MAG: restriction endonuclease subunit S [Candidatus Accumulibacter sp.]|nr:restriction endonuclease subunit S [Candidatus Accumulibacter conexus]
MTLTTIIRYPMGNDFNRPHEHPTVNLPDHLDLIAAAPDGIQKLRSLILELAVRGKLVPQDPNDEPASELLKRIARERTRLEAEGAGRKSKETPLVGEDEQPFALPNGWAWVRLGQIGDWGAGATPLRSNLRYYGGTIPWFKSGELTADFISDAEEHVTELALKECSLRQNRAGDVLIAMYGATIGKTAILAKPATTNQAVCACTPNTGVFNRYLLTLLKGLKPNFIGQGAGGAQPNISREKIIATVTALPPEAEQHRIVAKVDELMALCDRLEAEQADAGVAHARLVETLLGTLTQSTDAAELAANWQRLAEHFDTLFTTEASLDALKQTILQLAVMGKLVPQGTGHADPGWAIKRLDKLCPEIVDCPHSTPKWTATGKLCVRTSQFRPGRLDLSASRFVSDSTFSERISRLKPKENDILYSREGGILGVACRVPLGIELCLGQRMMLIRPGRNVSSAFLELVLNSPMITQLAREKTTGGAAPRVNVATVKAYPIPIPPIDEQHRIVAKVDELMALCDRLKAGLAESRAQQECLATTLIESALNAA